MSLRFQIPQNHKNNHLIACAVHNSKMGESKKMKSQCKNKIASLKNQFFFFNFSILMKWNHIYLEFDSLVGLMTLSTFPLTMFKQSFSFLTSIVYENASNYRSLSNRVNDAVEQCGLEYRH